MNLFNIFKKYKADSVFANILINRTKQKYITWELISESNDFDYSQTVYKSSEGIYFKEIILVDYMLYACLHDYYLYPFQGKDGTYKNIKLSKKLGRKLSKEIEMSTWENY